jgi:hypothetical protein
MRSVLAFILRASCILGHKYCVLLVVCDDDDDDDVHTYLASIASGEKSTLAAQLNVRQYLKTRFPKRPWIDIVSKADLELTSEVESQLPEGYLSVSVHNGANMKALRELLEDMLLDLKHQLAIRNSTTSTTTTTTTGGDDAASAGNSSQAE